jgi:peptidoglycan/LPS O-acetylase OafA/YrhL
MNYKIQIDGLRFFAIISVMIGHWMAWETQNPVLKHTPWGHGVILFFVISGFLITGILLNQKEQVETGSTTFGKAIKTFYIRRFFRIFPIYYLLLFYLYYIDYPKARELFVWLVTYTTNIYQGITNEYIGNFSHFWSLAIEEQFYILWPFLILLIPKKHLMKFFIAVMVLSFLSRVGCIVAYPGKWMLAAYFTPNLFLPLVLGAMLAYWKKEYPVWFYNFFKPVYAFAALIVYGAAFYYFAHLKQNALFKQLLDEYLFSLVSVFFIAVAATDGFSSFSRLVLENRFVNYIGRISYGVYVYHLFMINFFWDVFTRETRISTDSKHTAWFFYFLICFSLATLSFYLVEKPINNLKNRFKY